MKTKGDLLEPVKEQPLKYQVMLTVEAPNGWSGMGSRRLTKVLVDMLHEDLPDLPVIKVSSASCRVTRGGGLCSKWESL